MRVICLPSRPLLPYQDKGSKNNFDACMFCSELLEDMIAPVEYIRPEGGLWRSRSQQS